MRPPQLPLKQFAMTEKNVRELFGMSIKELFNTSAAEDVYTYSQSSGHFTGPSLNGGNIDTYGCSGQLGPCRNNPAGC